MTRSIRIRPEAENDLSEAYSWYSGQVQGLGDDFLAEVDSALASVAEFPEKCALIHKQARRSLVRRFPYGVFYIVEPGEIVVLAVMHLARDPELWKKRT